MKQFGEDLQKIAKHLHPITVHLTHISVFLRWIIFNCIIAACI